MNTDIELLAHAEKVALVALKRQAQTAKKGWKFDMVIVKHNGYYHVYSEKAWMPSTNNPMWSKPQGTIEKIIRH